MFGMGAWCPECPGAMIIKPFIQYWYCLIDLIGGDELDDLLHLGHFSYWLVAMNVENLVEILRYFEIPGWSSI